MKEDSEFFCVGSASMGLVVAHRSSEVIIKLVIWREINLKILSIDKNKYLFTVS